MTRGTSHIPLAIQNAARKADEAIKLNGIEARRRGGRPRKAPNKDPKAILFTAETPEELDVYLGTLEAVIGPRTRGNKRRGRLALYADLLHCFMALKAGRITTPRGGSLSRKAWDNGLANVLVRHGVVKVEAVQFLSRNGAERAKIGRRLKREFDAVALTIQKNTPHK